MNVSFRQSNHNFLWLVLVFSLSFGRGRKQLQRSPATFTSVNNGVNCTEESLFGSSDATN